MSRYRFVALPTLAVVFSFAAAAQHNTLTFRPVAADYSKALDRVIMVAGNPSALYSYDATNNVYDTVALSAPPLAISISLDGLSAAVLHSTSVSYVNLSTKSVVKNYPLPTGTTALTNQSIVFDGAWIYLPPTASINIATGAISGTIPTQGGFAARLHPNGLAIYTAGPQKLDISGALPSSNFNYYSGCAGVWFSLDGTRLYDQCGAYNLSTDPKIDLTYLTVFPDVTNLTGYTESASQGIAVIDDTTLNYSVVNIGTPIRLYNSYLTPTGVLNLPSVMVGAKNFNNYGRWVFYNNAGTSLFVVMQADSNSGLLNDYSVETYNFSNPAPCVPTLASTTATVGAAGSLESVAVTAAGDCMYQASSSAAWLQIVSGGTGSGNSTLTYVARANTSGASRTANITIGSQSLAVTQSAGGAIGSLNGLSVNVVDAAYNKTNDTIVYVSSLPNELHIYNPATGADTAVTLIRRPLSVSVSPDGAHAAVGHEGWMSYVDLSAATVTSVIQIAGRVQYVVLAGNGYIYPFTGNSNGYYTNAYYSYQISTGTLTPPAATTYSYAAGVARLHPSGNSIYYGSSSYIGKLGIANGVAVVDQTSNGANDCGNHWITDDGDRIITACSTIYRSSDVVTQDLQPNGSFSEAPNTVWADHSTAQSAIAAIPAPSYYYYNGNTFSEIQIYNDADLSIRSREDLPQFTVSGTSYAPSGKFIFWNNAGTDLYVIEQAPSTANLLSSYAVATVTPATCSFTLSPGQVTAPFSGAAGQITVTTGSQCRWAAASDSTWVTLAAGNLTGTDGTAPLSYTVASNPNTAPRTATLTVEGHTVTVTQAANPGTLTVSPTTVSIPQVGGSGLITVTTSNSALGWSANNSATNWVNFYSSGVGSGTASYYVYQNPTGQPARTGTVTIGNQTITFNQAGASGPPVYAGSLDSATCKLISGWVADNNRLNQSISVNIYDGAVFLTTVTANILRADVGKVLGDNGLHGFSYTFPSSLGTGPHNIHVYYETTSIDIGGSPKALTCGTVNYAGNVDSASCSGITGWVADLNRPNTAITVSLWDGSTQIASTTANGSRPDVGAAIGDNGVHGFTLPIPSTYANGVAHTLQVHYESSATQVGGSPVTINCGGTTNVNYTGNVDVASCNGIFGWVADRNRPNTPINVTLWDGGTPRVTTTASLSRPDVGAAIGDNGNHGFFLPLPSSYSDGLPHTLQVHFETSTTQVSGSPLTLTCGGPTGPVNYAGNVDSASCSGISGWAADRNRLNQPILVSLWDPTTQSQIASTTANGSRPDVGTYLGDNGLHGFTLQLPSSYLNGATHSVQVSYEASGTQLAGSPVTLTCGSNGNANYLGNVDLLSCTTIAGWAANTNTLNSSVNVSIYDGSTLLTTIAANGSRQDVGTFLGDNGLHGFSFATPASIKGGVAHTISVRPGPSSIPLAGPQSITCP